MSLSEKKSQHPLDEQIQNDRLDLLMREMRLHLLGGAFAALLVAVVFHPVTTPTSLWLWGWVNALVTVVAAVIMAAFHFRRAALTTHVWRYLAVLVALAWGGVWALSPWLFLTSGDLVYIVTLIVLLIGVCGSPASTLALYPLAYIGFITPPLASMTVAIAQLDFGQSLMIKLLMPVFWCFLLGYALNLHKVLIHSIVSRLEKEQALRQLEYANALRNRFLAAATHDIRQPLQAIGLHLSVLRERFAEHQEAALLERLHGSVDSMSALMDALLDMSRLDNQALVADIRHVAIRPALEKWLRQYEPLARNKGLALRVTLENLVVQTDPLLLERIFLNLFSNAVRYTDAGEIAVSLHERDGKAVLSVRDSGRGIAADNLQTIFEEFRRLGSPAYVREQGLGLGLAIVERMAGLLDHDVSVQSELGSGSTFAVAIPIGSADQIRADNVTPTPSWEMTGLKVLVLDDNSEIRNALHALLGNWHCDVRAQPMFVSIATGIAPPADWQPDFILCDDRLDADFTGLNAIALLREQAGRCLPAIILSGDENVVLPSDAVGMALLSKPVRPAPLRSAMQKLLQRQVASA